MSFIRHIAVDDSTEGSAKLIFSQGSALFSISLNGSKIPILQAGLLENPPREYYAEGEGTQARFSEITSFINFKRFRYKLIVVDSSNHRIRWFDKNRKNTNLLAGDGIGRSSDSDSHRQPSSFYLPTDIAEYRDNDSFTKLFVTERYNNNFRVIVIKGVTAVSVSTQLLTSTTPPNSLCVTDIAGYLFYVTDNDIYSWSPSTQQINKYTSNNEDVNIISAPSKITYIGNHTLLLFTIQSDTMFLFDLKSKAFTALCTVKNRCSFGSLTGAAVFGNSTFLYSDRDIIHSLKCKC